MIGKVESTREKWVTIDRSHPSHGKLDTKIKANVATAGLKAYFSATLNDRGQIELNIGNNLPVQPW
jgi:hypothetical protein